MSLMGGAGAGATAGAGGTLLGKMGASMAGPMGAVAGANAPGMGAAASGGKAAPALAKGGGFGKGAGMMDKLGLSSRGKTAAEGMDLESPEGMAGVLTDMLTGNLGKGGMVRKVSEALPKGPVRDFTEKFGNAFSPVTGEFTPYALIDGDTNKWYGQQRKEIEKFTEGDPGKRPLDMIVHALMQAAGGKEES